MGSNLSPKPDDEVEADVLEARSPQDVGQDDGALRRGVLVFHCNEETSHGRRQKIYRTRPLREVRQGLSSSPEHPNEIGSVLHRLRIAGCGHHERYQAACRLAGFGVDRACRAQPPSASAL